MAFKVIYVSDYPRIQINSSLPNPHKEGDDLSLTCTADSNPRNQQIKWTYGGHSTKGGNLSLTNLNRTDHGEYTCDVTVSTPPYGDLKNSSGVSVVVNCKYYNTVNFVVYVYIIFVIH